RSLLRTPFRRRFRSMLRSRVGDGTALSLHACLVRFCLHHFPSTHTPSGVFTTYPEAVFIVTVPSFSPTIGVCGRFDAYCDKLTPGLNGLFDTRFDSNCAIARKLVGLSITVVGP